MNPMDISFNVSKGIKLDNSMIEPKHYDVTVLDVPHHIMEYCTKRYITMVMQVHARAGRMDEGKIKIGPETLYYK